MGKNLDIDFAEIETGLCRGASPLLDFVEFLFNLANKTEMKIRAGTGKKYVLLQLPVITMIKAANEGPKADPTFHPMWRRFTLKPLFSGYRFETNAFRDDSKKPAAMFIRISEKPTAYKFGANPIIKEPNANAAIEMALISTLFTLSETQPPKIAVKPPMEHKPTMVPTKSGVSVNSSDSLGKTGPINVTTSA